MKTPNRTKQKLEQKIGHLCSVWASLDRCANMLVEQILGCSEAQAVCLATQMEPVATRAKLLKNLAYTTAASNEWKAVLISLLNIIDGELAPKRNRVIHDAWDFTAAKPSQLDRRAKVARSQARKPPELLIEARLNVTPEFIESLVGRVSAAATALLAARADLILLAEEPKLPRELTVLEVAVNTLMPLYPLGQLSE